MWALLLRRVRLLVVVALLLPVTATVARALARSAERRHGGPTTVSRGLRLVEGAARRTRSMLG